MVFTGFIDLVKNLGFASVFYSVYKSCKYQYSVNKLYLYRFLHKIKTAFSYTSMSEGFYRHDLIYGPSEAKTCLRVIGPFFQETRLKNIVAQNKQSVNTICILHEKQEER